MFTEAYLESSRRSMMEHFLLWLSHILKTYSRASNRRGGWNKWGGWQILVKIINGEGAINGEVGINGETGKNTAIRNFIEIKSSNDLVKISTKRI